MSALALILWIIDIINIDRSFTAAVAVVARFSRPSVEVWSQIKKPDFFFNNLKSICYSTRLLLLQAPPCSGLQPFRVASYARFPFFGAAAGALALATVALATMALATVDLRPWP